MSAVVALVGAGPGDPGLITARGLELLRGAQVLVYDRLVAPELVAEAPTGCLLIARDGRMQEEVNELLVRHGRRGRRVVRLKGGDPFLFGRGGEEALAMRRAGLEFEVVPGVSALSSAPAAAGIPITHRGLSRQVTIVTGHGADDEGGALDYAALARTPGTLVVFMGLGGLGELVSGLIAHGADPDLPAAVVSRGTTDDQEAAIATLATIAETAAGLRAPALVVVGEVVGLARVLGPAAVAERLLAAL
jgi:uroporphyrin-III C-methyltransferase